MLSASAFARTKPRKRCPQQVQARRLRQRHSFVSTRSRLRNVFISRSLPERQLRCLTGITPTSCRERSSQSIVVPSRCGHLAHERTPKGRAVPFYISVTLPDVASVHIPLRGKRTKRSDTATSRRGFTVSGRGSFNQASRQKIGPAHICIPNPPPPRRGRHTGSVTIFAVSLRDIRLQRMTSIPIRSSLYRDR